MNKRKKEYAIPVPKHIRIGDPLYWGDKNAKRLTCSHRISKECKVAYVVISEEEDVYRDMVFTTYRIQFIAAPNDEVANVYMMDQYYTKPRRTFKNLGCDTAMFEIEVDGRADEYHTGSDGYFGNFATYSNGMGTVINLFLDGDLVSYEQAVELAKYWFGYKED